MKDMHDNKFTQQYLHLCGLADTAYEYGTGSEFEHYELEAAEYAYEYEDKIWKYPSRMELDGLELDETGNLVEVKDD